jgi:hypothetical protein
MTGDQILTNVLTTGATFEVTNQGQVQLIDGARIPPDLDMLARKQRNDVRLAVQARWCTGCRTLTRRTVSHHADASARLCSSCCLLRNDEEAEAIVARVWELWKVAL